MNVNKQLYYIHIFILNLSLKLIIMYKLHFTFCHRQWNFTHITVQCLCKCMYDITYIYQEIKLQWNLQNTTFDGLWNCLQDKPIHVFLLAHTCNSGSVLLAHALHMLFGFKPHTKCSALVVPSLLFNHSFKGACMWFQLFGREVSLTDLGLSFLWNIRHS